MPTPSRARRAERASSHGEVAPALRSSARAGRGVALGRRAARGLAGCAAAWLAAVQPADGAPGTQASDPALQPAEVAFVELSAPKHTYFAHETIALTIAFGFERDFLRERAIQPFQRELDVPARIALPWLDALPGVLWESAAPQAGRATASVALADAAGERVARAVRAEDQLRAGRAFARFELHLELAAASARALELPGARLDFAWARAFEIGFLGGRVALDRSDVAVFAEPLELAIVELPREGRPFAFTGVVGELALRAVAEPRALAAGQSLALRVDVDTASRLATFEAPALDAQAGFDVRGTLVERTPSGFAVRYDLAPRSAAVERVPAIEFAYFDPGPPARYRSAATEPIAIEVRQAEPRELAEPAREPPGEPRRSPRVAAALALAVGLALAVLALLAIRRRGASRARPRRAAVASPAARRFEDAARAARADLAELFAEYLAERLACPVPAVIAPDLAERLRAAGIGADPAERTARLLDAAVAARYGGPPPGDLAESARALVAELDPLFAPAPA